MCAGGGNGKVSKEMFLGTLDPLYGTYQAYKSYQKGGLPGNLQDVVGGSGWGETQKAAEKRVADDKKKYDRLYAKSVTRTPAPFDPLSPSTESTSSTSTRSLLGS